jgi:Probable transposase
VPRLVTGRPIKSTNQYDNKRRAQWQEALSTTGTTRRMDRLTLRRTRRINHDLHTASKALIALLVSAGIGTLVVGKNALWKQDVELGRVNNQHSASLRAASPGALHCHAGVQGEARRHPVCASGRGLHEPGQLLRRRSHPDLRPEPQATTRLQRHARQAGPVARRGWASPERGCERLVQHRAQSTPNGPCQWDRGHCSSACMVDVCLVSPTPCVGGSVNRTNHSRVRY